MGWLDKKSRDENRAWEEEFLRFIRTSNVIAPNDSRNTMDKRFLNHEVHGTNKKPVHILDLNRRMLLPREDDSLDDNNRFLGVLEVLSCMLILCLFPILWCFYMKRRAIMMANFSYGRRY